MEKRYDFGSSSVDIPLNGSSAIFIVMFEFGSNFRLAAVLACSSGMTA